MKKAADAVHALMGMLWQNDLKLFGIVIVECVLLFVSRRYVGLVFFVPITILVSFFGNKLLFGRRLPHTGLLSAVLLVSFLIAHIFSPLPDLLLTIPAALLSIFLGYRASFLI